MTTRPTVHVFDTTTPPTILAAAPTPAVLSTPLRDDLIRFVHTNVAKNRRQAYGVTRRQGHRTTAASWGTGRAVARIPRAGGGGTNRSGQGAHGNMCRGGHMFAATKTLRRWHRHVNRAQRRLAVCSALAATAVPALVLSRGHRVEGVPELPLVVSDAVGGLGRTRDAVGFLRAVGAYPDVEKVEASRHVRPTKGKWRNRRYVARRGPLLVTHANAGGCRGFGNIRGVEVANVESLNLLQLAPGGHLGRFVIWTQSAFARLNAIYGTRETESEVKKGWKLPMPLVTERDIQRVMENVKIREVLKPKKEEVKAAKKKVAPKKSLKALSPYAGVRQHNRMVAERALRKSKLGRHQRRRHEVKAKRDKKTSAK